VKGVEIESTVSEAILLSAKVYANLQINPMIRYFEFTSDSIESSDFRTFLEFVRSHDSIVFPIPDARSFVLISEELCNDRLTGILLSSLQSGSGEVSVAHFRDYSIEECASQFFVFSIDAIRCVDHQTLHRLLSSTSLRIENEDSLIRLLVDLDVDRSEFFGYIEVEFLSRTGLSQLIDELRFEDLTESIWFKIVRRLKLTDDDRERESAMNRRFCRSQSVVLSMIVKSVPSILKEFSLQEWELLYRGSRDGFAASTFHKKCDGQSNTVALIETTEGWIFGGFTPLTWDSNGSFKSDDSQRSFLFSLKNPDGSGERKFALSDSKYAIRCYPSYGPTFGGGYDICITDACDRNTASYSKLGHSYGKGSGVASTFLTGAGNFTVKEIEVFTIHL
jgi:hypothetical protein